MANINLTSDQRKILDELTSCDLISDDVKKVLKELVETDWKKFYDNLPVGTVFRAAFTSGSSVGTNDHCIGVKTDRSLDDTKVFVTSNSVVGNQGTRWVVVDDLVSITVLAPVETNDPSQRD